MIILNNQGFKTIRNIGAIISVQWSGLEWRGGEGVAGKGLG